jgi:hypothetical protein
MQQTIDLQKLNSVQKSCIEFRDNPIVDEYVWKWEDSTPYSPYYDQIPSWFSTKIFTKRGYVTIDINYILKSNDFQVSCYPLGICRILVNKKTCKEAAKEAICICLFIAKRIEFIENGLGI